MFLSISLMVLCFTFVFIIQFEYIILCDEEVYTEVFLKYGDKQIELTR